MQYRHVLFDPLLLFDTTEYTEFMFLEEHGFARLDNSIQGEKGK